jgi:hypothetical protein
MYVKCMWALVAMQVLFALVIAPVFKMSDCFPFSAYQMFAHMSREWELMQIYVVRSGGRTFSPPVPANDYLPDAGSFLSYSECLKDLRQSWQSTTNIDREKLLCAKNFLLGSGESEIELRMSTLDILAYYRRREIKSERLLGRYRIAGEHVEDL